MLVNLLFAHMALRETIADCLTSSNYYERSGMGTIENGWTAGGCPAPTYEVVYGPDRTKLTLPLVTIGKSTANRTEKPIDSSERPDETPESARKCQKVPESARKCQIVPDSARKRQSGIELRKNADLAPLLRKIG